MLALLHGEAKCLCPRRPSYHCHLVSLHTKRAATRRGSLPTISVTYYDPANHGIVDFYEVYESDIRQERIKQRLKTPEVDLPPTVKTIDIDDGGKVYLVGCSHVSLESQQHVRQVIESVQPDVVVLESDQTGIQESTTLEENKQTLHKARKFSISALGYQLVKQGAFGVLMYLNTLEALRQNNIIPAGEMRVAYRTASTVPGCAVHLGDLPADVTAAKVKATGLGRRIATKLITNPRLLWQHNALVECVNGLIERHVLPVYLADRDKFLTHNIRMAAELPDHLKGRTAGPVVVGVVGDRHVAGIISNWHNTIDHEALARMPRPPILRSLVKWTAISIPAVAIIYYQLSAFKSYIMGKHRSTIQTLPEDR